MEYMDESRKSVNSPCGVFPTNEDLLRLSATRLKPVLLSCIAELLRPVGSSDCQRPCDW